MFKISRSLGLLLVVPWLASCVARPGVRLETGPGVSFLYVPPATEPPPVEVAPGELAEALVNLTLQRPLTLRLPQRQGRVVLADWGASTSATNQQLMAPCPPDEPADGCLRLPSNAPPPQVLARLKLALSYSMDTAWEGAALALREYADPLALKVMVYSAMSVYLLTLLLPEPVTKGLAAILTVYLVAYLGLGPVWSMVRAGKRLLEEVRVASTTEQVKGAGQRFGQVLGDNGMRVFLLLVTAALGGSARFTASGPRLPGFQQAARASPLRTGVRLEAANEVQSVVLTSDVLVVGLAPTAVAATAMGPGQGGGAAPQQQGSLTGRPRQPRPGDDEATRKGIQRENESAKLLAQNGYHVEQNPATKINNKNPDYKINGDHHDCLAPTTSNVRNIASRIAEKVRKDQADKIVLNLDDTAATIAEILQQLTTWPIPGLKHVIIIKGGQISTFNPQHLVSP